MVAQQRDSRLVWVLTYVILSFVACFKDRYDHPEKHSMDKTNVCTPLIVSLRVLARAAPIKPHPTR
jgi:hypothetical protein